MVNRPRYSFTGSRCALIPCAHVRPATRWPSTMLTCRTATTVTRAKTASPRPTMRRGIATTTIAPCVVRKWQKSTGGAASLGLDRPSAVSNNIPSGLLFFLENEKKRTACVSCKLCGPGLLSSFFCEERKSVEHSFFPTHTEPNTVGKLVTPEPFVHLSHVA